MTLQVFGPPITKHELTKKNNFNRNGIHHLVPPKINLTEKPKAKKPKVEETMPIK